MKGVHPAPFFVLRAPLLCESFLDDLMAEAGTGQSYPNFIEKLLNEPAAVAALSAASPEFLSLVRRRPSACGETSRDRLRQELTALKYLLRMSRRCTPFGLFASLSVGRYDVETELFVGSMDDCRRHIRLDGQVLLGLCSQLLSDDATLLRCPAMPNATLYKVGRAWRFVEPHTDGTSEYTFYTSSVPSSPALDAALEVAAKGGPVGEIVPVLVGLGHSDSDSRAFVVSLVREQVLISALMPNVLGADTLDRLAGLLARYAPDTACAATIRSLSDAVRHACGPAGGDLEPVLAAIAAHISALGVATPPGTTFHIDLFRDVTPRLSRAIPDRALRAADALRRLSATTTRATYLAAFRERFLRHYGDRDVPLLHLFDPDLGIASARASVSATGHRAGYGLAHESRNHSIELPPAQQMLASKMARAAAAGDRVVSLAAADLDSLGAPSRPFPPSFAVLASLFHEPSKHPRSSDKASFRLFVRSLFGGSAATIVGRFLHGDATLYDEVTALAAREAATSAAVLAEIDSSTGPRTPNVSRRPRVRAFEIPIVGPRDADDTVTIALSDLFVRLDAGQFVLWSASLGRAVRPRFSSMHQMRPDVDLELSMFLIALQAQEGVDYASEELVWGSLATLPWLPRVETEDAILTREQWRVSAGDLLVPPDRAGVDDVTRALDQLRVSRHVTMCIADHELPLDLHHAWCLETILVTIRRWGAVCLRETLSAIFGSPAFGRAGTYANELVIPFERIDAPRPATEPSNAFSRAYSYDTRRYHPGSDWVYAKLYLPVAGMDAMLTEAIGPCCENLCASGLATRWFFIRYVDSADHLRVRLRCSDRAEWRLVYETLAGACRDAGTTTDIRIELGTYDAEARRYGGDDALELSETLFWYDSRLVVSRLCALNIDAPPERRLIDAVSTIAFYHDAFGLDMTERRRLTASHVAADANRWSHTAARERRATAGSLFRRLRREVMAGLSAPPSLVADGAWARQVRHTMETVRRAVSVANVVSPASWINSFAHMHCNRAFNGHAQDHEYLAYALLDRAYDSLLARRENGDATVNGVRRVAQEY